ncbi:MAG: Matrixin [Frankiaceae bacterium]|jgi:hypothetical protein|nr:Matrixin [Frankiaceae bacterium]
MVRHPVRATAALAVSLTLSLTTVVGTAGAAPLPAAPQVTEPVVVYGPSDADSIPLLSGSYYVNSKMAGGLPYWWDHTNLTAAVQSAPTTDVADVQAAHDAISVWTSLLAARLPGISLTDISRDNQSPKTADIVVHLVPHAGGIVWGGSAVCGSQKCLDVLVKTDQPPGQLGRGTPDIADFTPLRVERETLHELGHALGLGHASPVAQSIDIMGYGWAAPDPDVPPILSDCDLLGIKTAFGWFYNHEAPHASPIPEVIC